MNAFQIDVRDEFSLENWTYTFWYIFYNKKKESKP